MLIPPKGMGANGIVNGIGFISIQMRRESASILRSPDWGKLFMSFFKRKKKNEIPMVQEEAKETDWSKNAVEYQIWEQEEETKVKMSEGQGTDIKTLLVLADIEKKMEQGYLATVYEDREEAFSKALGGGLEMLERLKRQNAPSEMRDLVQNKMCECLLQIEWLQWTTGNKQDAKDTYDVIKMLFPEIKKPSAMAHFAMAHGFWLLIEDPTQVSEQEWISCGYHYSEVTQNKEEIEMDFCGAVGASYYSVGIIVMHGYGVEKNHLAARAFLEQAKACGVDCQEQLDKLEC